MKCRVAAPLKHGNIFLFHHPRMVLLIIQIPDLFKYNTVILAAFKILGMPLVTQVKIMAKINSSD